MTRPRLAAFDHGVGAVIVDALKIFGLDAVPVDVGVGLALERDGADEVFYENGIIVGAFGDMFFVGSFQKRENFRAGTGFNQGNEVFDPNCFAEGDFESNEAALIVSAALTNGFAAGAKRGDGNGDGDFKAEIFSMKGGVKVDLVIH